MNIEKIKNPLYKNVKTNVVIDTKHKNEAEGKLKLPQKISMDKSVNKNNVSIESLKGETSPKSINKIENISNEEYCSPILPRGKPLLISTPYGSSPTRKEYEENLKNKEKWMNKKGFINKFNSNNKKYYFELPTYVWQSPPAIAIHKYQYRDVNKEKWISKKEFAYKNSHDLII